MNGQAARFVSHFEKIAMSDDTVDHQSMQSHPLLKDLPQLDPAEDAPLRTASTPEEGLSALKAMKRGTAYGPDGVPVESYIAFWNVLGEHLCGVLFVFLQHGSSPDSFRARRIILLQKSNSDPTDPATWRPITLLNVDSRY